MTNQEIDLKVRDILSKKLGVGIETISGDSRLAEDLGVDSFGAVELMFEIEEAFALKIPDSDIEHVRSVKDIVVYLDGWLNKAAGAVPPAP
jgi:acyl carrier protein